MPVPRFMSAASSLTHHRAGQSGEGVGQAQADGDGEGGVDGGGPDHVRVVPGGPDGQAQPGVRKSTSRAPTSTVMAPERRMAYQSPPMPVARKRVKMVSCRSRDWLAFQPMAIRLTVYRPGVGDDARQDGGHPQLGLEEGGDESGAGARQHGGGDGQEGVAGSGEGDRHRAAQHKAAVGGHIGDVQHTVAEEQGHGHQGVLKAQLQGRFAQRRAREIRSFPKARPSPGLSRGTACVRLN